MKASMLDYNIILALDWETWPRHTATGLGGGVVLFWRKDFYDWHVPCLSI